MTYIIEDKTGGEAAQSYVYVAFAETPFKTTTTR